MARSCHTPDTPGFSPGSGFIYLYLPCGNPGRTSTTKRKITFSIRSVKYQFGGPFGGIFRLLATFPRYPGSGVRRGGSDSWRNWVLSGNIKSSCKGLRFMKKCRFKILVFQPFLAIGEKPQFSVTPPKAGVQT